MFERFTERARYVVVLAQDEARVLTHNYIGTEHLLLGLLREEEGVAARVLRSLGVEAKPARAQVVRIVGQGDEVTPGQIPFTPRAKKVLDFSLREALSLGDDAIGTEHILLGLARENEGVGSRILLDFGVDAETIRDEVIRVASAPGRHTRVLFHTSGLRITCPNCRHGINLKTPVDLGMSESRGRQDIVCQECGTSWVLDYALRRKEPE